MKYVVPSTHETAFNCPHCGALAKQFWSSLHSSSNSEKLPLPFVVSINDDRDFREIQDNEERHLVLKTIKRLKEARPFLEKGAETLYGNQILYNVNISECFNCNEIAIWIYDHMLYPVKGEAPPPNLDLPEEILRDYREASTILALSPRGAAALIRLAIQKLCKHLGQPGKNINDDIKALVATGLDPRVQKALDAVRVIGNNAVHPGHIDLSDDRPIAETLFRLLNLVAEKMISDPKHVDEVYASLPPEALAAIAKRDKI